MADSVTVEQGGLTVTTNTASEADLRAELTRDEPPVAEGAPADPPGAAPPAPPAERDPKGRFLKRDLGTAPAPEAEAPSDPPAAHPDFPKTLRRRD